MPSEFIDTAGEKFGADISQEGETLLDSAEEEAGKKAGASSQANGLAPDAVDAPGIGGNLTAYGKAYHQAALAGYTAKASQNIDDALTSLYQQNPTDTAGFAQGWQDYKSELLKTAPPEVADTLSEQADAQYNKRYLQVWAGQIDAGRSKARGDLTDRWNNISNQISAIAAQNPNDPQLTPLFAEQQNIEKTATTPLADGRPIIDGAEVAQMKNSQQQALAGTVVQQQATEAYNKGGLAGLQKYDEDFYTGKINSVSINGQSIPIGAEARDRLQSELKSYMFYQRSIADQNRSALLQLDLPNAEELLKSSDPNDQALGQKQASSVLQQLQTNGTTGPLLTAIQQKLLIAKQAGQDAHEMGGLSPSDQLKYVNNLATSIKSNPSTDPNQQAQQLMRFQNVQRIYKENSSEWSSDPYGYYEKNFPAQAGKFDLSTDAGVDGLQNAVKTQLGLTSVPPLPKPVMEHLTQQYKAATDAAGKARVLGSIFQQYPEHAASIVQAMDLKGTDLVAGQAMAQGQGDIGQSILGAADNLASNKNIAKGSGVNDDAVSSSFDAAFGQTAFGNDNPLRSNMEQAYSALYYQYISRGESASAAQNDAKQQLMKLGTLTQINGNPQFLPNDANASAIQSTISSIEANPTNYGIAPPQGMTIDQFQQAMQSGKISLVQMGNGFQLMTRQGAFVMQGTPSAHQALGIAKDGTVSRFLSMQPETPNPVWNGEPLTTPDDVTATANTELGPQTMQMAKTPEQWAADVGTQAGKQKLPVDPYIPSLTTNPAMATQLNGIAHAIKGGTLPDQTINYLANNIPAFSDIKKIAPQLRAAWANEYQRVTAGGVHMSPLEALTDVYQKIMSAQINYSSYPAINGDNSEYLPPTQ